ncbi:MAG TPA: lysine--tRNA ligase [Candidatus Paceibacterota bacterium]|nr:lysine--tRNA ligase [Candidatus Paceibacterota bacterium]
MALLDTVRAERLAKIERLKKAGMEPYPNRTGRTHSIEQFLANHEALEQNGEQVILAGRAMSIREHGGSLFVDIFDGKKGQCFVQRGKLGESSFDLFIGTVDTGDIVEFAGGAFTTKRGMPSLNVTGWRMLAKSLRPLPDEWFGIKDEDERFRKRYLDIVLTKDLAERIKRRSRFWNVIRSYLLERDFIEVETPVFETTTGGAEARPFKTHHNALDMDVYLRISAGELWQKRLMVAGLPKTFEIGRVFRNEGMSAEHAQDYTAMEFYWAYADYLMGMELVEDLYKRVALETFGTLKFSIGAFTVDLGVPWERYDYVQAIRKYTDINIMTASLETMEAKLREHGITFGTEGWNTSRAIDTVWKYCRRKIGGPGFLIGMPKTLSPLAKSDPDHPGITERFQPIIAGSELGNGYSELNDPVDQAERFTEQAKLRAAGDEEAQMYDHEFVEALEYGMPPAVGFGVSERLFSFLEGVSIREGQIFPLLRPR